MLRYLLQAGFEAEGLDKDGDSPLYYAAATLNRDAINLLIIRGVDVYQQDPSGATVFEKLLTLDDDYDAVINYIECIDLNSRSEDGQTVLHMASIHDAKEVIDLLLEKGSKVNAVDNNGWSPLCLAVLLEKKATALALIKNGTNLDALDGNGQPLLHTTVAKGNEEMVGLGLLLEHGANIHAHDKNQWTALHMAVSFERAKVVELLLRHDANINTEDKDGFTPLYRTVLLDFKSMASLLVSKGADVDHEAQGTPLLLRAIAAKSKMVKLLLEAGANPNKENSAGVLPLCCAIAIENLDSVRQLLEHGADPNLVPKSIAQKVKTPLELARELGNDEIFRACLTKTKNDKETG